MKCDNQRKNKNDTQINCIGCDRNYARLDSLKRHQWKCDEYQKFSKNNPDVINSKKNPFACNKCQKSYIRSANN